MKNANSELRDNLALLLRGESITSRLEDQIVYADIQKSPTTLLTFLVMTGYLKILAVKGFAMTFPRYEFIIPNLEIARVYQAEILDSLKGILPQDVLMDLLENLR